jgi:hypothetical protein
MLLFCELPRSIQSLAMEVRVADTYFQVAAAARASHVDQRDGHLGSVRVSALPDSPVRCVARSFFTAFVV